MVNILHDSGPPWLNLLLENTLFFCFHFVLLKTVALKIKNSWNCRSIVMKGREWEAWCPCNFLKSRTRASKGEEKKKKMKCQILLRIALDISMLHTFPNINNIHSCSFTSFTSTVVHSKWDFIHVWMREGLIYISMGDALVWLLNIACW